MATSGFSLDMAPVIQFGQPVRSPHARPFRRGNRLYTLRFQTVFLHSSVAAAEDWICRLAVQMKDSAGLSWLTTPPNSVGTWYLWKAKLAGYSVPQYLGCSVPVAFTFVGSNVSPTPDPNPDPDE